MRVVMLGEMSGTRDGQPWPPRGSQLDLPDEEAIVLVRNKMAAPVAALPGDAGVEKAVLSNIQVEVRDPAATVTPTGPVPAQPVTAVVQPAAVQPPSAAPTAGVMTVTPEEPLSVTPDPAVQTDAANPLAKPLTTDTGPVRKPRRAGTHTPKESG